MLNPGGVRIGTAEIYRQARQPFVLFVLLNKASAGTTVTDTYKNHTLFVLYPHGVFGAKIMKIQGFLQNMTKTDTMQEQ